MSRAKAVAEVRLANNGAGQNSVLAKLPPADLVERACELGDPALLAECQVSVALAFERAGNPLRARRILSKVASLIEAGAEMEFPWTWRYLNSWGNVLEDFGSYRESLLWHHQARTVADDAGRVGFPTVSRANLGLVSMQIGSLSEALGFLSEVAAMPGMSNEYRIVVNLMVAGVLAQRQQFERADEHLEIALGASYEDDEIPDLRMLRTFATVAIELDGEAWAPKHVDALRRFADDGGSEFSRLESLLFEAKLDRVDLDAEVSIGNIREVIDSVDPELALHYFALVTLAKALADKGDFEACLEVLDEAGVDSEAAAVVMSARRLRRTCLESLGRWEEAADLFGAIEAGLGERSEDVVVLYELQQAASHAKVVSGQNHILREKNNDLEALARDQELILETVANKLQSPLTSLQLALDTIDRSGDPSRWLGIALRSIHRIDTLALQLSLSGEIEAGGIVLEEVEVDLVELLDAVVTSAQPGLRVDLAIEGQMQLAASQRLWKGDSGRFRQLLEALVWGIAEFSPEDSRIRLSVSAVAAEELLVVVDAPGMLLSQDMLNRMRRKAHTPAIVSAERSGSEVSFYVAQGLADLLGIRLRFEDQQFFMILK